VLLVDDNEVNREVLEEMLRRLGHEVTAAIDGEQAQLLLESSDVRRRVHGRAASRHRRPRSDAPLPRYAASDAGHRTDRAYLARAIAIAAWPPA
jgi:CheY-like chemotaxis protein